MKKVIPVLLALLLLAVVSAACSGSPTPAAPAVPTPGSGGAYPVATSPTPTSAPYPVATSAPSGGTPPVATRAPYPVAPDGKALVSQRCTVCHDTGRIEAAKKNMADWQATVNRMKGKGAVLDDIETQSVVAYLTATFK